MPLGPKDEIFFKEEIILISRRLVGVKKTDSLILFLRYFIGFSLPARFTLLANDCPILQKNSLKWLAISVGLLSTFISPTLITLGADEFDNFE